MTRLAEGSKFADSAACQLRQVSGDGRESFTLSGLVYST